VDLDRLVSIRVLDLWKRAGSKTYFMLRDEYGARLAVPWLDVDTHPALRRALRRRKNIRLSPLAALLIDVQRERRAGPDCPDVRVVLKMTLIIFGAAVAWIVESGALSC